MTSQILEMRHFCFLNVNIYNQMKHLISHKDLFIHRFDVSPSTCRSPLFLVIVQTDLYVSEPPRSLSY